MEAQQMEQTLRKMVRVLLVLLALAIVAMIAILWQTPIGDAWRQIFVLLFGTRATPFMYLSVGAILVVLAVLALLVRRGFGPSVPRAAAAPMPRAQATTIAQTNSTAQVEQPLVLEPLSPKTEGTVWRRARESKP